MMQQAIDFRDESEALYQLLEPLTDADFDRKTLFEDWTINHVVGHLHMWNWAADLSLKDDDAILRFLATVIQGAASGGLRKFEDKWLDGRYGQALLREWREFYLEMSERFAHTDPKKRVKWAGPNMSVRSSITARLMETWAHGQEIYDQLGVERQDAERIRNIAHLGVNTFGWTFKNRGMDLPGDVPHVKLNAPSGNTWEWNPENTMNRIEGSATEFCQVVTQTRNIADTGLAVTGDVATRWMAIAQCFAGPPEEPPAPGSRHIVKRDSR
jgi:uncharacterized protein (TIGR03084 family)